MKTVLLIDDDAGLRSLLKELLAVEGWTVLEAGDGEEGLKIAFAAKPDVVLCDLLMPRCNGFQFCRAVKERRGSLPKTRIVVTAGSGYDTDRISALEAGADEYVTKPIKAPELLALLDRMAGPRVAGTAAEATGAVLQDGSARIKFWGVRGSIPSPGPQTMYYGGNTSCVEVRADGGVEI